MASTLIILLLLSSGSISGFVTDKSNGERLSYVNVSVDNGKLGAATNDKGYYIVHNVPPGSYTIVFSHIGYESKTVSLKLREIRDIVLNVEMIPTYIEMEEIRVSAERSRFERSVEVSHINFTPREIKSIPVIFENDLIRTLQLMPGVVAMHDLSNKLYVRGGSPDENLVLLDGITIYNPSTRLFGLFSIFNTDAVSHAELYAGGFPAKYGDRLSSVLDVTTKEGNSKKITGKLNIGLITSKLLLEGPLPKGSFLLGARITNFDPLVWIYRRIESDSISLPHHFYDGIVKINFNTSPENRFTFAGISGSDDVIFENVYGNDQEDVVNLEGDNRGASLRWRRVFSPKFYGEMLGAWSNFRTRLGYVYIENYTDTINSIDTYEEIVDYTIKCDFNYFLNEKHSIDIGIDGKHLDIEHDMNDVRSESFSYQHTTNLFTFYLQDTWTVISDKLYIKPGLRSFYYDQGKKLRVCPRLGVKYAIEPNTALNLAIGKYNQFLITINSQESYLSIFDFWRPLDEKHDIPTAYHVIVGIEKWLGDRTKFTIEPYYKKYYNLLLPKENDIILSTPTESLRVGSGYSTGFDLFFKKSYKDVFGWINYSLNFTKRNAGGESYSPRYDRRHNLNIVLGFVLPSYIPLLKNGTLNLRWYFATGLPYTEDVARYRNFRVDSHGQQYFYEWRTVKSARGAYRLPLSHRLDLHLEKDMRLFGLNGSWYIDVMNLYNHKDIIFYTWKFDDDPPEKIGYILLPIPIPSIGFTLRF